MYRQLTEKEIKNFERHIKVLQAYMECNSYTAVLAPLIYTIFEYMKEVNALNNKKEQTDEKK